MNRIGIKRVGFALAALLLSACSGGGGGGSGSGGPVDDDDTRFISGRVLDANTNLPVENALIKTVPPTEIRLTDREGYYLLRNSVLSGEVFDVIAQQVGYTAVRQTVSLDSTSSADFSIVPSVNGLVSSVSILQIPSDGDKATFLLSSTLDNTPFGMQTSDPQFSVVPRSGTLARNQLMVIEVMFTPQAGQSGRVGAEIVANAENGGTSAIINVTGNVPRAELQPEDTTYDVLIDDAGMFIEKDIAGPGTDTVVDPEAEPVVDPTCDQAGGPLVDAVIAFDDLVTSELASRTASRTYGFCANSGDRILVSTSRISGGALFLQVELNDRAGALIDAVSGTAALLETSVPADGQYFIRITNPRQDAGGSFEFTLQRANAPGGARSIGYRDVVQDALDGRSDLDAFRFEAQAGDTLTMPFSRISGGALFLEIWLRDSSGELLDSISGTNGVFTTTIPESGTYYVWVRNPRLDAGGEYEFNLDRANQ